MPILVSYNSGPWAPGLNWGGGWNRGFDPNRTALAGLPVATLQAYLTAAQAAYNNLMVGGKVVTAAYDGKSVTYTQADIGRLESYIMLLQRMLGINRGRRPMVPIFR